MQWREGEEIGEGSWDGKVKRGEKSWDARGEEAEVDEETALRERSVWRGERGEKDGPLRYSGRPVMFSLPMNFHPRIFSILRRAKSGTFQNCTEELTLR